MVAQPEVLSEGAVFKTGIITTFFFLMVLAFLSLVADYARAWQVSHDKNACFRALGFGFSKTFKTLFSSYPLMLILLSVQLLYGWFVLSVLGGIEPASEGGIILLFLFSAVTFLYKDYTEKYGGTGASLR